MPIPLGTSDAPLGVGARQSARLARLSLRATIFPALRIARMGCFTCPARGDAGNGAGGLSVVWRTPERLDTIASAPGLNRPATYSLAPAANCTRASRTMMERATRSLWLPHLGDRLSSWTGMGRRCQQNSAAWRRDGPTRRWAGLANRVQHARQLAAAGSATATAMMNVAPAQTLPRAPPPVARAEYPAGDEQVTRLW